MLGWGRRFTEAPRSWLAGFALTAMLSGGCVTLTNRKPADPVADQKVHPVALQAQFDLNCQRPELRYLKIADDQWGVLGCGKRARYRRICETRAKSIDGFGRVKYEEKGCRWLLDSPVMVQEAAEPEAAPAAPSSGI